jgi:HPt (histidine-containing phosphotransfer) domain-containing protein
LYEISDNDRDFIKEMLLTVVKNTPDCLNEIRTAQKNNQWIEVARLVHKLKPSLLLLNIDAVSSLIRNLENKAKEESTHEEAATLVIDLEQVCKVIIAELNKDIKEDVF